VMKAMMRFTHITKCQLYLINQTLWGYYISSQIVPDAEIKH